MMKRRNFLKVLGLGFGAIFVKPTDVPEVEGKIEAAPGKIEDWKIDEKNARFTNGFSSAYPTSSSVIITRTYSTSSSACYYIDNWNNGGQWFNNKT